MRSARTIPAFLLLAAAVVLAAFALSLTSPAGAQSGWEGVRQCESGGDYSYNDGAYQGAYNFDEETWQSVGGEGTADQASPAEQDARAQMLYNERGSDPWPNCGGGLTGGEEPMSTTVSESPGENAATAPPAPAQEAKRGTGLTG